MNKKRGMREIKNKKYIDRNQRCIILIYDVQFFLFFDFEIWRNMLQVYFEMLDVFLVEEKMLDEFVGQIQVSCNFCYLIDNLFGIVCNVQLLIVFVILGYIM